MSRKETFEKAYGNLPKELPGSVDWDWIPTMRGLKYYYLRLTRFFTR